jgi:ribonuclease HI
MIRPVIDYGCTVYSSASASKLKKINVIQSQALRISCGAFRTSPIPAMQVEMAEMPLDVRRLQLKMSYWSTLKGHDENHPVKKILEKCWEYGKGEINSFGWNVGKEAQNIGINNINISPTVVIPSIPPWLFLKPDVDLTLQDKMKKKEIIITKDIVVKQHLSQEYYNSIQIFTDGSKSPDTGLTAAAVFIPHFKYSIERRITDHVSVYTAEMIGILMALQWVEEVHPRDVVICSDSYSALMSINSGKSASRQDILYEILQNLYRIYRIGVNISFLWVPAHVGVEGNEEVDQLAKRSLKRNVIDINVSLSKTEVKAIIKSALNKMWQQKWDKESKGRHLYNIQNKVGVERSKYGSRKEDAIISRLRIGHTCLNYSLFIIGKRVSENCDKCGLPETVEHVLIHCIEYNRERTNFIESLRYMGINTLSVNSIFQNAQKETRVYSVLMRYLRETGLVNRI